MILNKSSYERGFPHASVYKTKVVDLAEERQRTAAAGSGGGGRSGVGALRFSNHTQASKIKGKAPQKRDEGGGSDLARIYDGLDDDGIAPIGAYVQEGDPICC